jgi:hypothetical protein
MLGCNGFNYGYDCEASYDFVDTQVEVHLTFPWRMFQKVAPDASHWQVIVNGSDITILVIEWLDDYTLKLKTDSTDWPERVLVNHTAVGYDCKFKHGKQFELFSCRVASNAA